MTKIIRDGIRQGLCKSDYPEEVVEMVMLYSNVAFDELAALSPEQKQKKAAGFIYNLERLLGMEQGSLTEVIMPIFRR